MCMLYVELRHGDYMENSSYEGFYFEITFSIFMIFYNLHKKVTRYVSGEIQESNIKKLYVVLNEEEMRKLCLESHQFYVVFSAFSQNHEKMFRATCAYYSDVRHASCWMQKRHEVVDHHVISYKVN